MSANTPIEWADDTFNPWHGCTQISPGCANCYAKRLDGRKLWHNVSAWGREAPRFVASEMTWKVPLAWNLKATLAQVPRRVFCGSMCDVGEARPDLIAPRARLVELIGRTPSLNWLLLSKRPENFGLFRWPTGTAPRNVWLGTSVEGQDQQGRIYVLRRTMAAVRFVSVEPLLEPVRLDLEGIHWVIIGGESGPGARPCAVEWMVDVVRQARAAGAAVFVKQLGDHPTIDGERFKVSNKGNDPGEWKHLSVSAAFHFLNADGSPVRELPRAA